jgi:uncharacterized small protein (DUF1192 family)
MSNKPIVVITHHVGGTDQSPLADSSFATVKDVDEWHKARWPEFRSSLGYWVGYHYFIAKDGTVTQTRKHEEEGAHTLGMNSKSIGVCFAGNFDATLPTEAQMGAWRVLYASLLRQYPNIPTYPHRKYATKTCHGKLLKDDHFSVTYQVFTLKERIAQLQALIAHLITQRRMK